MNCDGMIDANIAEFGWSCIGVMDDPEWTYSIGFWESYNHPEVIIYGLPHTRAHEFLWDLHDRIKDGERFEAGTECLELLPGGYRVTFCAVPEDWKPEQFGQAHNHYEGEFEAVQMVWPDADGFLPWEDGYFSSVLAEYSSELIGARVRDRYRRMQPVPMPPKEKMPNVG